GEEDTHKCSSTSSCARGGRGWEGGDGGSGSKRPCKKLKQKKIPQRGLGVAQLEKLRLAEQQKREAALQAESSVGIFSPNNKVFVTLDSSSNIADQCQNPILSLDNLRQRSLQTCSSSMVNASPGISPLASVMNFQMEPPSNQSYYGNNYTPFWPEHEKTLLFQRQYLFPLEIPPASPSRNRLPSTFVSQLTRSGESALYGHRSIAEDLHGANTIMRGSSSSGRITPGKDNLDYDYGFLTLAPPTTTANQELPRTIEECLEDPVRRQQTRESSSGSYGQQFYCFLPTPNLENGQKITSESNCSSSEIVDLSLKL
ncbi:hypothetical protein Leryth_010062, partial [Lithospermum erythrorhizon]